MSEEKRTLTIIEALEEPKLFRSLFGDLSTWRTWFVCLKATFGLPMTEKEQEVYRKYTGRECPPEIPFKEIFLIIGRRGGKSRISSIIAVFLALFKDWTPFLARGELAYIFVIASDRDQARNVFEYIKEIFELPQFKGMLEKEPLASQIRLINNIVIEVRTASWRGLRGYTVVAAICDELGVWRSEESSNPSKEIIGALKPGMVTVPESMLIGISTPHARKGVLWEAFQKKYGKDDPRTLVWRSPSKNMNPLIDQKEIDDALEEDYAFARAEWFAEFRADIEDYLSLEDIRKVTMEGQEMLLPAPGTKYVAFTDPSGGKHDSFTLAIAHEERGKVILDLIVEIKAPFNPQAVTADFCRILKKYQCHQVVGDKFSGNWVASSFKENGIIYVPTNSPKSELYLTFQALVKMNRVELLDNKRLAIQLQSLERRVHSGSHDTIDHPAGLMDDVANSCAGVCVGLYKEIAHRLTPEERLARMPHLVPPGESQLPSSRRILEKESEEFRKQMKATPQVPKEGELNFIYTREILKKMRMREAERKKKREKFPEVNTSIYGKREEK